MYQVPKLRREFTAESDEAMLRQPIECGSGPQCRLFTKTPTYETRGPFEVARLEFAQPEPSLSEPKIDTANSTSATRRPM